MESRQDTLSAKSPSHGAGITEQILSTDRTITAVYTSCSPALSTQNALYGSDGMPPHASPSLDLPDELVCQFPAPVAMNDWTPEQRSIARYLNGVDLMAQKDDEENGCRQLSAFTGENMAGDIGMLPPGALEVVHVGEPDFTAEQSTAVRSNTTINELHSLLEQAPQQSRGIDEVLVASGAGRDRLSDRSAHVPSPAANDIGWLPTASFYYYYPPLALPEAPPPTTSTDTPSAAGGRFELRNQGHLSIAAASRQDLAGPPRHQRNRVASPQPVREAPLDAPMPSDVPPVNSVETHEPRTSEPHYIIDVSPPTIRLHQPDSEQGRGMSPVMTGETSYPSPTSEAPAGSPVTMALSEQMMMDKQMSQAPVEVARPKLAIRRDRDPPRNAAGQLYCDHPDCSNHVPTFRRPCEWNKHMDKHDRPYKCQDPDCDKLAGFTYSGGLLRHQREVHKMHAPGRRLMCPFPNCNRSSGKGFTRQENLKEHIRRLHKTNGVPNAVTTVVQNDTIGAVHSPGHSPGFASPTSRSAKRRRLSTESSRTSEEDIHSLRDEVVRLRRETREKDTRLDELEKIVAELRQRINSTS